MLMRIGSMRVSIPVGAIEAAAISMYKTLSNSLL